MKQNIAVITGGNRGIGLELCKQISEKKWQIYLTARDINKAKQASETLKNCHIIQLDVSDQSSVDEAAKYLSTKEKHIDLLINNAGIFTDRSDGLNTSIDNFRRTLEVNTLGAISVIQSLAPLLKSSTNGQIINVSSGMGQLSEMGTTAAAYRISKTALNAITKILSHDFEQDGVLVNSICPGWVKTDMGGANAHLEISESVSKIVSFIEDKNKGTGKFFRHGKEIPW